MLKNISSLGSVLNKTEQLSINGGIMSICPSKGDQCRGMLPVNCITSVAYCCVNGFFEEC